MNILVTGGAGFIGSHVVEALLDRGYEVTIVDNFNDYYSPTYKRQNLRPLGHNKSLTVVEGDITDKDLLANVFQKTAFDKVIHLAASVGVRNSLEHPDLYKKNNVGGTKNVLDAVGRFGVKHFLFASSSSVYGNNSPTPFREERVIDSPLNPYAETKRMGELLCLKHHQKFNTPITIFRFFTVYGPNGRPDMSPYIFTNAIINEKILTIFGDGTAKRDFTYITDLVQGIMAAIEIEFPYEVFNLGSALPIDIKCFIEMIEKITGKKAKIEYKQRFLSEMRNTYSNIQKAESLFGYKPKISIEKGLEVFIKWYLKNRT